jgi:hypothetical protein
VDAFRSTYKGIGSLAHSLAGLKDVDDSALHLLMRHACQMKQTAGGFYDWCCSRAKAQICILRCMLEHGVCAYRDRDSLRIITSRRGIAVLRLVSIAVPNDRGVCRNMVCARVCCYRDRDSHRDHHKSSRHSSRRHRHSSKDKDKDQDKDKDKSAADAEPAAANGEAAGAEGDSAAAVPIVDADGNIVMASTSSEDAQPKAASAAEASPEQVPGSPIGSIKTSICQPSPVELSNRKDIALHVLGQIFCMGIGAHHQLDDPY